MSGSLVVKSSAGWLLRTVMSQISRFEEQGYDPNNGLLDKLVAEARHLEDLTFAATQKGLDAEVMMELAGGHYKWFLLVQYYCLVRNITHEKFTELLASRGITKLPV